MKSEEIINEMKEEKGIKKSYELYKSITEGVNALNIMARYCNCFSTLERIGRTSIVIDEHCYLCGIIDNRYYSISFETDYISIECEVFDK